MIHLDEEKAACLRWLSSLDHWRDALPTWAVLLLGGRTEPRPLTAELLERCEREIEQHRTGDVVMILTIDEATGFMRLLDAYGDDQ